MVATTANRNPRTAKARRQDARPPAAAGARQSRQATSSGCEGLPSRQALSARLEAQRAELLRAMAGVHRARRTIEGHIAYPPYRVGLSVSAEQHADYRQRVLEALGDASEALGTAYPLLERIAAALEVEEMLKEQSSGRG